MAIDNKVGIFTTSMRTEFLTSYEATAVPWSYEKSTTVVPSTARIEHYTWMSPAPGLAQFKGHRRYGKVEPIRYSVENEEFDGAFEALARDIEDDMTGGYKFQSQRLAAAAKSWPSRWVLKHLAAGGSRTCFDGSNFFANSHTIGTGDNLISFDGGANDGADYNLVALFTGGPLKPLLWQDRKPPDLETDGGTPQSKEAKKVKFWLDMEGQAAYGYWWDAIWVDITDTPTVAEMQTIFGNIARQFRTFQLPQALASDEIEYIHEQQDFSEANLHLVGSTGLERILAQALNENWIPQNIGNNTVATTNLYKGWASYSVTNYLPQTLP